jgi:hypothetical protein
MINPIVGHIDRLLRKRVSGKSNAELVAESLLSQAIAGDSLACKILIDAIEQYDSTCENAWETHDEE